MKQNIHFTIIDGFKSASAQVCLRIAALGFLAALGFIPGWSSRLFGFSGFFGFIGVAYILEIIHRLRNRKA